MRGFTKLIRLEFCKEFYRNKYDDEIFKAAYIFIIVAICFCNVALAQANIEYDIVLIGGRVIDPETKLDTIKNVGIIKNRIAQISVLNH
ncbi:MAG: hypothetical protein WKF59_14495 [Chitinophagaceae bacterium]